MFNGAVLTFFPSGQRCGVKRSKVGQVTIGFLQRACCFRRYSVMIESRAIDLLGTREDEETIGVMVDTCDDDSIFLITGEEAYPSPSTSVGFDMKGRTRETRLPMDMEGWML